MKIHTIDYKKHFWSDGTVYRQFIKIDKELANAYNKELYNKSVEINEKIEKEKTLNNEEMKFLCYTIELHDGINYTTQTGLYYFWNAILKNWIDTRGRFSLGRNTIIEVL